jgi:GH15 family glucan-1,4-alpha-glucosidase
MGLPEHIGGERNWDYRYTWLRDAALALYALIYVGFEDEARHFMAWLRDRCQEDEDGLLQPLYGIDGRKEIVEIELDHLSGYMNSRPVRLGNGAYKQRQLDLYGAVLDAAYLYNKHGAPLDYDLWKNLRKILDWLSDNWRDPDEGIWEVRGGRQQFVSSKLLSWVALERAGRISRQRGLPAGDGRWMTERDAIYEEIMEKGWNPEKKSFVQVYGSDALDASLLMMPLVKFVGPTDPRWISTLDRIQQELTYDTLVDRYKVDKAAPDGLEGEEGASASALSGSWSASPRRAAWRRPASPWRRCSLTPTTWGYTLRRSGTPARPWATFPRPSPTSPSSAPPSTSTARSASR